VGIPEPEEIEDMVKKTVFGCFLFVVFLVASAFMLGVYLNPKSKATQVERIKPTEIKLKAGQLIEIESFEVLYHSSDHDDCPHWLNYDPSKAYLSRRSADNCLVWPEGCTCG